MSQTSKEGLGHLEARSLLVATANVDRTFITDINSSFLLKSYYTVEKQLFTSINKIIPSQHKLYLNAQVKTSATDILFPYLCSLYDAGEF